VSSSLTLFPSDIFKTKQPRSNTWSDFYLNFTFFQLNKQYSAVPECSIYSGLSFWSRACNSIPHDVCWSIRPSVCLQLLHIFRCLERKEEQFCPCLTIILPLPTYWYYQPCYDKSHFIHKGWPDLFSAKYINEVH